MAKAPMPNEVWDEDELVARLVHDASDRPPDVTMIAGFAGKSPLKDHWRLYLTPELTVCVDIPDPAENVLHYQKVKAEDSPLGMEMTMVWIKRGANLLHTGMMSRESQLDFLQGNIAQSFLGGQAGINVGPLGISWKTIILTATSTLLCHYVGSTGCPTVSGCPTQANTSRTSCCLCPT